MENSLAYNEILYLKRKELNLSKKKMAKFLGVSSFLYGYYEAGYIKPNKKAIENISKALDVDYATFFEDMRSYPVEIIEEEKGIAVWFRKKISKLWAKLVLVGFTLISIGIICVGCYEYNYVTNNSRSFYSEKYLEVVDGIREKGGQTYSLLHEFERPEIHYSIDNKFISITGSTNDYSIRSLNAYVNYKNTNSSVYYIVPNLAENSLVSLDVQYVDYLNLTKYISSFTVNYGKFYIDEYVMLENGENLDKESSLYKEVQSKMSEYVDNIKSDFNLLLKEKLGLSYDFYDEILQDHAKGASVNVEREIRSLALIFSGIGLTGLFLFTIIFSFFFAIKNTKSKNTMSLELASDNLVINNDEDNEIKEEVKVEEKQELVIKEKESKNEESYDYTKPIGRRTPKKDIRFFPFIPETVFEIIGIILVMLGSIRIIYMIYYIFAGDGINYEVYDQISKGLFSTFTIGMFLLYFIDFDIYLDDKRSLRNLFGYLLVFIGLYVSECILVEYLIRMRGLFTIVGEKYIIPNNFGSIAGYFAIMFFLFYNPKFLTTKKRTIIFRSLSIIPILWIFIMTLIFENYKSWGWDLPLWGKYFFNSERPQFSILCVCYLVGLYFIRLFFKHRYGEENAKKFFCGNRFYFIKNIFICLLVALIAIFEYILKDSNTNIKGIGNYYQIAYLIPILFFYHPHHGSRNKGVDYLTLGLYGFFLCFGYIIAGLIVLGLLLR